VLAGYLGVAILTCQPLSTRPSEVVPANADALYNAWAIAWIGHQLPLAPSRLFEANMFFPDRAALLYSEPILGVGLLGLPFWLATGDAALVYNHTLVMTLVMSAFTAFLLTRELTGHTAAAVLAGGVFAFTTANLDSAARIQTLSSQWTPLLLYFLVRLWRRDQLRDGFGLGISAAMQGLSNNYYTLYLTSLLFLTLPLLFWLLPSPRRSHVPWRGLLTGSALSAAILAPMLWVQYGTLGSFGARQLNVGALPQSSYWNVLPGNWLFGGRIGYQHVPYDDRVFLGFWTLALALVGLAAWAKGIRPRDARARAWFGYFVVFGLLAFLLGCGRSVPIPGFGDVAGPYAWLHRWVPGFEQTRVPARYVMFVRLAVALFAGLGVAAAASRFASRRALARAGWLVLAVVIPLEHLSTPLDTWSVPRGARLPEVYRFLPTLPKGAILEYPQSSSRARRHEALWLSVATSHWFPMLNGYGSRYPLAHYFVQHQLVYAFPNVDSLRMLRALGVRYVVFHPDHALFPELERARDRFLRKLPRYRNNLQLLARFDDHLSFVDGDRAFLGGESVYRVLPDRSPAERVETDDWPRVSKQDWRCRSSVESAECRLAIDGDADTSFSTGRHQRTGDAVEILFPRPLRVRGVSVLVGRHAHEYPRRLQIMGLVGKKWYPLADWNTLDSVEFVRDVLERPDDASLDYVFEPREVTAMRLRIGPDTGAVLHPWILPEVDLLAAE